MTHFLKRIVDNLVRKLYTISNKNYIFAP